jgi:hypothetical protein
VCEAETPRPEEAWDEHWPGLGGPYTLPQDGRTYETSLALPGVDVSGALSSVRTPSPGHSPVASVTWPKPWCHGKRRWKEEGVQIVRFMGPSDLPRPQLLRKSPRCILHG